MYIGETVGLCIYLFRTKKNSYVLPLQKFTGESREGPAPLEIQY